MRDEDFREILSAASKYFASERDMALFTFQLNGVRMIMFRDASDPEPEFPPNWEITEGKMPLEKLSWASRCLAKVDASNTAAILEALERIHDAIRAPRNTRTR